MWHKAIQMGHPIKNYLTQEGWFVLLANHYTTGDALYVSGNDYLAVCICVDNSCLFIGSLLQIVWSFSSLNSSGVSLWCNG